MIEDLNTINVMDFYDEQKYGSDMTLAVLAALEQCRLVVNACLKFPKGIYHFWPDDAFEHHYWISNNDPGIKKIAFPLLGFHNLVVDGNGSEFIFHGRILPFVIDYSSGIIVKDIIIDYDRPFFSQALIVEADSNHVDLSFDKDEFPYRVEDGKIVFYGSNWESEDQTIMLMTEFSPATKAPAYQQGIYLTKFPQFTKKLDPVFDSMTKLVVAEERPNGVVRLTAQLDVIHKPGNILTIGHEDRYNPGFFLQNSENIHFESVTIYHVGSMGVIAQLCTDIHIKSLRIKLREGTSRIITTNADATHFVNCKGLIEIEECVFENMLDDATNIHGICTIVSQLLSKDTIEVELQHYQQFGINFYIPGDLISFIDRKTLLPLHNAVVKTSVLLDSSHLLITMEDDIEGKITINDAVYNFSRMPSVLIRKCRTGRNRSRGLLITTPMRTVIEENVFYNAQFAINITGDANYWFESGAVRDILIQKNHFLDCGYANVGGYIISISPEIGQLNEDNECYHRGIVITNNDFETYENGLLYARSVNGLTFTENRYKQTCTYQNSNAEEQQVMIETCKNVKVEDTYV